jgi:hypothetical protein
MKILVATNEGQGKRKNDFNFCYEGEAVKYAFECDGETVDGGCGCRRAMSGIVSFKATTTFKIVDSPVSKEDYILAILDSERQSFGLAWSDNDKQLIAEIREDANQLLQLAKMAPEGTVLEKRGDYIKVRVSPPRKSVRAGYYEKHRNHIR